MAKISRKSVFDRASHMCEYCHLSQEFSVLPHQIDHVRATKHRGPNTLENVCLSCAHCNAAKGPNVAGYDPESGILVPLFNPRLDVWKVHFRWDGAHLVGLTAIGRTTIELLRINDSDCVEQREVLIEAELFPPESRMSSG